MKKQLYSLALLTGMMLTIACSVGTEDVQEPAAESKTVESIFTIGETAFSQVVLQDSTETEGVVEEIPEEAYESPIGSYDWSKEEGDMLAKIAMAEAEGESTEGKALVILVVLNRVWSDGFPDTIEEVLFQRTSGGGWQFSPMQEGGRWYTTEPNEDCYAALDLIMKGWDESYGALYFESSEDSTWHSEHLEFLYKVGNHKFYR